MGPVACRVPCTIILSYSLVSLLCGIIPLWDAETDLKEEIMGKTAGRTIAIGIQDFGDLIRKGYFYIDKTEFIREWWDSGDSVP